MIIKEYDLIKEMLQMQAKLDEAIMKEYGLTEIDEENLRMAILDEVGELTHELKGEWCWWKKTQTPVDNDKVLGELVDVWHFVLSWQNHFDNGKEGLVSVYDVKMVADLNLFRLHECISYFSYQLCQLVNYEFYKIPRLIAITEHLGFTIEQVYEAYCDKNKVNYQRLESWY